MSRGCCNKCHSSKSESRSQNQNRHWQRHGPSEALRENPVFSLPLEAASVIWLVVAPVPSLRHGHLVYPSSMCSASLLKGYRWLALGPILIISSVSRFLNTFKSPFLPYKVTCRGSRDEDLDAIWGTTVGSTKLMCSVVEIRGFALLGCILWEYFLSLFLPLPFPLSPTPGPLFAKLYISQVAWLNRAVFLTYLEDWGSSCPLLLRCCWGRTCISARSYDSLGFSNKIIASWSHKAVPAQALKVGRRESVSSCFCLPVNQIFPQKLSGDIFLCSIGQQCILHP